MTGFDTSSPAAAAILHLREAIVAVALGGDRFLLDDGRLARQALSCLVGPEIGDRALVAASANGDCFIVHLLARAAAPAPVRLGVPGANELRIVQPRIVLQASEEIALQSLRAVEVSAATGTLALNANDLHCTVNETLVQTAHNVVAQAGHYLLQSSGLLRLQGQHAILVAEHDVKVDGERISVG